MMKNTKKVLAVLLVLVMAIVALTGCGGGGKDAGFTPDANSVLNTNVLRVGMECGYAPYNWTQADDSNGAVPIKDTKDFAYGYDVMMAKLIAEELGYELEIQRIDWDSLPVALQSGKLDCVIAGQSITAERLQTVDFSEPYYYADVVCLVKADGAYGAAQNVADLAGATCTSQINTIWYDVLDQIADVDKLPPMETVPNMLVALDTGKVELVCTDMPTAMAAVVAYPDMKIVDFAGGTGFEVSDEEVNIGISIQKGNAELVEKINSVLANLTEEDYVEMMKQAIAVQPLSA
ncbi:MAG: transporter substrate-binding domain-containing protein [Firmicutes bacterium]|nr:transporter substrate-binding domain-containing protein [Bacillota bacterium]